MARILVCTDGSGYAKSVYRHAAWAAEATGLPLQLLHVLEQSGMPPAQDLSGAIGFEANAELLAELARLDETRARVARMRGEAILEDARQNLDGQEVSVLLGHGGVVDQVNDLGSEVALVVIGKRGGHADFAKGHLGSNLERVVRSATSPVLVCSRSFQPIQRILIAYDGGPSSQRAVRYAADERLMAGCRIHLLGVARDGRGELAGQLDEAVAILQAAGREVSCELRNGDAIEQISGVVKELPADLLVIGAYGHSRIRQFILGSTTTSLVRTCLVPVLMFR